MTDAARSPGVDSEWNTCFVQSDIAEGVDGDTYKQVHLRNQTSSSRQLQVMVITDLEIGTGGCRLFISHTFAGGT